MRAIMETAFDIVYFAVVLYLGIRMLRSDKTAGLRVYGLASLLLIFGDAFHLIPRMIGLNSAQGLAGFTAALGIGKLITSITMTVFYLILYVFAHMYFHRSRTRVMDIAVLALAAIRIILCLMPQNQWTSADSPVLWGVIRNIPFVLLGCIVVWLLWQYRGVKHFKWGWLAVVLSFSFYVPVVLWADVIPVIGMLMIPKTCCYVWLVVMGFRSLPERRTA